MFTMNVFAMNRRSHEGNIVIVKGNFIGRLMAASVFHLVKTGNFSISEAKTCPKIKLTQLKWKKQVIMKDHLIWTKILKIRRIHLLLQVSGLTGGRGSVV